MAYNPNPMNANGVDERSFMDAFNQYRPAIEAYKQQHGGDLEGAFHAVTGNKWPDGRSVKIHDGVPVMTKDRTFKSILGKYVAPIAAGAAIAFVPGLAPMLGHALGIGGGGAGAAGTSGLGADVASAMAVPGTVGTTAGAGSTLATIASKAATGKSIIDRIRGGMHDVAPVVSTAINTATEQAAGNRGEKLKHEDVVASLKNTAQSDFERQLIARAEEDRAAEKDARARVTQDEYNINRKPYEVPTIHSNVAGVQDFTPTNWGIGRTAGPTEHEIAALTSDRDRARGRLTAGSTLPPVVNLASDPYYTQPSANLNPGTMERIGQFAGPAVSIWDKISKYL